MINYSNKYLNRYCLRFSADVLPLFGNLTNRVVTGLISAIHLKCSGFNGKLSVLGTNNFSFSIAAPLISKILGAARILPIKLPELICDKKSKTIRG